MVAAYIGSDMAYNKEDARRIEKAEKTAEQRVTKHKAVAASAASQPDSVERQSCQGIDN